MGRYEFGPAKPTDTRSQERPFSSLSWREKDLKNFERKAKRAYLQSQAGSRPTSKEDYRSFSRGSNLTFLSASEKLMMESDRPRLLHRESIERRLQQSSTPRPLTADTSESTEPKKQVTLEIRVDGLEEEEETTDKVPETRVADPQIDSFGEDLIPQPGNTFITSSKTVRTSPDTTTEERGPSKLYKRFGSAGSDRSGSVCSKHGDSKLKSNRNLYSARSGSSYITAVSSVSKTSIKSHSSSCDIPGPHSLHISNTRSVTSGPNCALTSLLGQPETPRNISKGIHHNSAWYHVPGRYSTPDRKVPPKRSQKTKESVVLQRKYGYQPKTYGKPNSSKYSYGRISFSKKSTARDEQNTEQEAEFGPMVKGYQMPSTGGYTTDFDYAQHEGEFETVLDPGHHSGSTVKFKEAVIVD